jgi:hypothetical protein
MAGASPQQQRQRSNAGGIDPVPEEVDGRHAKMHFSAFITNPCSCRRRKMVLRCCLCSMSVQLATSRSSWKAKQKASLFFTLSILRWKMLHVAGVAKTKQHPGILE